MLALLGYKMNGLAIFTFLVLLAGCMGRAIVMPDMPALREVQAYRNDQLVCFDRENEAILQSNMKAIVEYSLKLRNELLRKQKEEKSWLD